MVIVILFILLKIVVVLRADKPLLLVALDTF